MQLSASERLRNETAALHKSLEQTPVSRGISGTGLTPLMYVDYLKAFYCLHHAVEERVFPVVSGQIDTASRSKIPALRADIQHLGHEPENCVKFSWPDDVDLCFALGAMYVTEGSTLGSMFLHKHIDGQLQGAPSSFLTIYGRDTAAQWRRFLEVVNTYAALEGGGSVDKMVAGANFVFSAALQLFQTQITHELQEHS